MPTTSPKNTRVIQMIQNAWKTSVKPVNLQKNIQSWDADSQLSEIDASESSDYDESDNISFTMLIHENKIIKKVIKCLEQKEFYNDWEQMVIEFKENTHRKQIQVAA